MISTAAARGALIQKTHRQDKCSISHPPSTGTEPEEMAWTPDQFSIAHLRLSTANEALVSAMLPGTSIAPPSLCADLAAMSSPTFCERPHPIEASANTHTPRLKTRLRPSLSP